MRTDVQITTLLARSCPRIRDCFYSYCNKWR